MHFFLYSPALIILKKEGYTFFLHSFPASTNHSSPAIATSRRSTHTQFSCPVPLFPISPSLLHPSGINHGTLNSDWRHSQGRALLPTLPSEYNSRAFCLPKWTLREGPLPLRGPSDYLWKGPGWWLGNIGMEVESKEEAKGKEGGEKGAVTAKWLGRSTAPGELCSFSLRTPHNTNSKRLATGGFCLIEWKTAKREKKKGNGNKKTSIRKDLSEIQRSKNDRLSPKTLQLPGTKARADRWKKRKMGPSRLLDSTTTKTWLYVLLSCANKGGKKGRGHLWFISHIQRTICPG